MKSTGPANMFKSGVKKTGQCAPTITWVEPEAILDFSSKILSSKHDQNQNQNCLLVIRPRTIIHQDLCLGKLVPSPHKRSKLSN